MVSRKLIPSTIAALAFGAAALASAAPASAGWKPFPYGKHHGGHFGGGMIAAGVVGGFALGAAAAASAAPVEVEEECYLVRRQVMTPYGMAIRQVQVCE